MRLFAITLATLTSVTAFLPTIAAVEADSNYMLVFLESQPPIIWKHNPVRVYMQPGDSVPGYRPEYKTFFEKALSDWQSALDSKLDFKFVDDQSKADIFVQYVEDPRSLPNPKELGVCLSMPDPANASALKVGQIKLCTKHADGRPLTDSQALQVALHEIGHAIGILGHSDSRTDIMYAELNSSTVSELSARDLTTIRMLYGPEGAALANRKLDISKLGERGSMTNRERAMAINNEAVVFVRKHDIKTGFKMISEAYALDPTNLPVLQNMGLCHLIFGQEDLAKNNLNGAESHYKTAASFFEKVPISRSDLLEALQAEAYVLRVNNKLAEHDAVNARIKSLGEAPKH